MAEKAARGTKRTCQNSACGARFYDLGREHIACPICGSAYVIAHGPAEPAREERRPARKPEVVPVAGPEAAPEVEAEDALADVEGAEEPIADGAEDDTFLEEEEDAGGDVSGIVGGGGDEDEET
ncbi:MAG: FYDLN acid domain-containing protein [Proteobacteria bacterium]|nr:FYDLN acid domain-containing protein [Pseudomonadota bacterium]